MTTTIPDQADGLRRRIAEQMAQLSDDAVNDVDARAHAELTPVERMTAEMRERGPGKRGGRFKDLTGIRFGRLVAQWFDGIGQGGKSFWVCRCDCGKTRRVSGSNLLTGGSRSCGCLRRPPFAPADLAGVRFGRLVAVEVMSSRSGYRWRCVCDCGGTATPRQIKLLTGRSTSCGCLRREMAIGVTTHGKAGTQVHRAWLHLKDRCYDPAHRSYAHYGGRGITVCDRWRDSFEAFFADMGDPPPKHSLDRINNDGNYEPGNCRWATATQQANNRRGRIEITAFGESRSAPEWATDPRCSVSASVLRRRITSGWSPEDAVARPKGHSAQGTLAQEIAEHNAR